MAANMQETLDRILGGLQSGDADRCLNSLQELDPLRYSSPAILKQLELLAIQGSTEEIRSRANRLIRNPVHQNIRARLNTLNVYDRLLFLEQIEQWETDRLIAPDVADVLKQRYNFDRSAKAQSPTPAPAMAKEPPAPPAPPPPVTPAGPRPSLLQTLLSESSIKIYLYLGAFFVIASALILAALVEAARLPILTTATLVFGAGALLLHKRLPQPSFALFIVFSFLLPIDANVLVETTGLTGPNLSSYWTIVSLVLTGIWVFSTWFYESRLFSAASFVSLCLAFYSLGEIFDTEAELQILLGLLASLAGLAGVYLLKKWKGAQFALFVFSLAQLLTAGLLILSFSLSTYHFLETQPSGGWWLVVALTWLAAASFYALSDFLYPFFFFPWLAAGALLPLPWFILAGFEASQPGYALGFWAWAAVYAVTSQVLPGLSSRSLKKYHWPLLAGSAALFLVSFVIALFWKNQTLSFTLTALTALVYTALHVARPRWYVWSAALLCALSAYFLFFHLPLMQGSDVPIAYQFLIAGMLLLVPGLFSKTPLSWQSHTQLPALVLGVIASFYAMTALVDLDHTGRGALVLTVYAFLFMLYAFHTRLKWLGYFAAAAASLAVVYALDYFELDLWLPVLTAFSVLLYGAGFWLRRGREERKAWGNVLVISGLALGALLSLASLGLFKESSGWYILLIAGLFALEMFTRPLPWLELAVEGLLSLALYMILDELRVTQLAHFSFAISLIWLGGDLLFDHLIREKRPGRPLTVGIGYILAALSTFALWDEQNALVTTVLYSIYTVFFACYAILQHEPRLGYLATAFLPLAVFKLCDVQGFEEQIFPLILIAILYYASGFWLRHKRTAPGWDQTLLYSGLGLGVVTSLLAPTEGGLESSIPVAIAATLFAVEALARRNVWLAVPANALYLMSYFLILLELDVDEPQFYSIGAALLGMLMHYLLTRAGSRRGAFIAGMLSQLVLLGTTYLQMVSTEKLSFFFLLFVQCMVVLIYGLVQRSRSLLIAPILFAVVGVITVVYSALKGLGPVILIGTTGLVLLMAGIAAVLMRERISKLGEQLSDWKP